MRLINARTLELEEFFGRSVPRYAALSHTWGADEVSYHDWANRDLIRHKSGYRKIVGACVEAVRRGLDFVWADTNCIDKKSSAELSEAINSMFDWYMNSAVCLVYLADVDGASSAEERMRQFRQSRWFTRGWTLQELLAPETLLFFDRDWGQFGGGADRRELTSIISEVTGIKEQRLIDPINTIHEASVAERMSWMARRTTTRVEDVAYCLLGIFDINMPLLYGEGPRAFFRLQEEIVKTSPDQTIFCWDNWMACFSVFAPTPVAFHDAAKYVRRRTPYSTATYTITNAGIAINLPVVRLPRGLVALLDVGVEHNEELYFGLPLAVSPAGIYYRNAGTSSYLVPFLAHSVPENVSLILMHRMSRPALREFTTNVIAAGPRQTSTPNNGIIIAFNHEVRVRSCNNLENSRFRLRAGRLDFLEPHTPPGGVLLTVWSRPLRTLFAVLIANVSGDPTKSAWAVGGTVVRRDEETESETRSHPFVSGGDLTGLRERLGSRLPHEPPPAPGRGPVRGHFLSKKGDQNPYLINLQLTLPEATTDMAVGPVWRQEQDITLHDPYLLPDITALLQLPDVAALLEAIIQ